MTVEKAGEPIRVGPWTIVPIERTSVTCVQVGGGVVCHATRKVTAVVVKRGRTRKTYGIDGEPIPLSRLPAS